MRKRGAQVSLQNKYRANYTHQRGKKKERASMEKSHLQQHVEICFEVFNGVHRAAAGKVPEECCDEGHQKPGSSSWQSLQRVTLRRFIGDLEAAAGGTTTGEINSDDIYRTLKKSLSQPTPFLFCQLLLLK